MLSGSLPKCRILQAAQCGQKSKNKEINWSLSSQTLLLLYQLSLYNILNILLSVLHRIFTTSKFYLKKPLYLLIHKKQLLILSSFIIRLQQVSHIFRLQFYPFCNSHRICSYFLNSSSEGWNHLSWCGEWGALICIIHQFPCCKYTHHGGFQTDLGLTSCSPNS